MTGPARQPLASDVAVVEDKTVSHPEVTARYL